MQQTDASSFKWVTYGRTESGDDLQVILWQGLPSNDRVNETYKELYPEEYEFCDGVNWSAMMVLEEK